MQPLSQEKDSSQGVENDSRVKWTPYTTDELAAGWNDSVHFSFKYINTNATGGVRLGDDEQMDLPYLSLRTTGPALVELDYCQNNQLSRQTLSVASNMHDKVFRDAPPDIVSAAREIMCAPRVHGEVNCDDLPVRLRQIIIQDESGEDIALSPLVCAGLYKLLLARLSVKIQAQYSGNMSESTCSECATDQTHAIHKKSTIRYVKRGFLNLGGSNPFNGGALIISMRQPLWFSAPVEKLPVRRAFALYYQGISLQVPVENLKEMRAWRQRVAHSSGAALACLQAGGTKQLSMLRDMVLPVIKRAKEARRILTEMQDVLPKQANSALGLFCHLNEGTFPKSSSLLPKYMRALLDKNLAYSGWRQECAYAIYLAVISARFWDGERTVSLDLHETDANRVWVDAIKEML